MHARYGTPPTYLELRGGTRQLRRRLLAAGGHAPVDARHVLPGSRHLQAAAGAAAAGSDSGVREAAGLGGRTGAPCRGAHAVQVRQAAGLIPWQCKHTQCTVHTHARTRAPRSPLPSPPILPPSLPARSVPSPPLCFLPPRAHLCCQLRLVLVQPRHQLHQPTVVSLHHHTPSSNPTTHATPNTACHIFAMMTPRPRHAHACTTI